MSFFVEAVTSLWATPTTDGSLFYCRERRVSVERTGARLASFATDRSSRAFAANSRANW